MFKIQSLKFIKFPDLNIFIESCEDDLYIVTKLTHLGHRKSLVKVGEKYEWAYLPSQYCKFTLAYLPSQYCKFTLEEAKQIIEKMF